MTNELKVAKALLPNIQIGDSFGVSESGHSEWDEYEIVNIDEQFIYGKKIEYQEIPTTYATELEALEEAEDIDIPVITID